MHAGEGGGGGGGGGVLWELTWDCLRELQLCLFKIMRQKRCAGLLCSPDLCSHQSDAGGADGSARLLAPAVHTFYPPHHPPTNDNHLLHSEK